MPLVCPVILLVGLFALSGCGVQEPADGRTCRGKCDFMDPPEPPPDPEPFVLNCHPKGFDREFTTFNTFALFGSSPPSPQVFNLQIHLEEKVTLTWELRVVAPYRGVAAYPANARIVVFDADAVEDEPQEIASLELDEIPVNRRTVPVSADARLELPLDAWPGNYQVMLFADPRHPEVEDIRESTQSILAAKCTPAD